MKNIKVTSIINRIEQDLYNTYLFFGYISKNKIMNKVVILLMIDSIIFYPNVVETPKYIIQVIQHICLFLYCFILRFFL